MYVLGNPVKYRDLYGLSSENIIDGPVKAVKPFFRGIGNILSGRPWRANHNTSLVRRNPKTNEWAWVRNSGNGLVKQSYLNQLQSKVDRFNGGDASLAWASRLMNNISQDLTHTLDVISPTDLTANRTDSNLVHLPMYPKILDANVITSSLPGAMNFDISRNNRSVQNMNGFINPLSIVSKARNSDNFKFTLSRIQPSFGTLFAPTRVTFGGTTSWAISVVPNFTYQMRVRVRY